MRITVFGKGNVGGGLADRLAFSDPEGWGWIW
jgi:predicted dinucleotide-binding enzyme